MKIEEAGAGLEESARFDEWWSQHRSRAVIDVQVSGDLLESVETGWRWWSGSGFVGAGGVRRWREWL